MSPCWLLFLFFFFFFFLAQNASYSPVSYLPANELHWKISVSILLKRWSIKGILSHYKFEVMKYKSKYFCQSSLPFTVLLSSRETKSAGSGLHPFAIANRFSLMNLQAVESGWTGKMSICTIPDGCNKAWNTFIVPEQQSREQRTSRNSDLYFMLHIF